MTRPRPCAACGINPIAYGGRKYCYDCVPKVCQRPVRCKRCGSRTDYFTAGLCRRCHRSAPLVDSCLDCLAWGVTRHLKWLCEACHGWRRKYPRRECPSCGRELPVNDRGFCRLCCRQATVAERAKRLAGATKHPNIDVVAANRYGQQLFFADLILKKRNGPLRTTPTLSTARTRAWPARYPVPHRQLVLFDWARRFSCVGDLPAPPLPDLAIALDRAVEDHAAQHGWRQSITSCTCSAIHVVLAIQDTPGAKIRTTEIVAALNQLPCATVRPVLEVLAAVGMLDDDRQAPLETWFIGQTAGLPEAMATEVDQWFHALRDGSTTTPRSRPRSLATVRHRITDVSPLLHAWALAGHESLREITRQDILDALPAVASRRRQALDSFRSLFRFLKARRLVFANPTARLRGDRVQSNYPLPMELKAVRDAINSTDPAQAALAALMAFHAPRNNEIRMLKLTDVRDGRLLLPDRTVVLAAPVRDRLTGWLNERSGRWPNTVNPHLFINFYTAIRTCPVSVRWVSATLGIPARTIREDRILHEALATRGDVRRLADLFGLTVQGAERYAHTTDQPTEHDDTIGSPTQGPR